MTGESATIQQLVRGLANELPRSHCDERVGRRLAKRREELGLSHRQLAFAGCISSYLCRIEVGQRKPSLQNLLKLAVLLRISPKYLAFGQGSEALSMEMEDYIWQFLGVAEEDMPELEEKSWQVQLFVASLS